MSSDPSRLFVQWTLTGAGADTQRAEYGATPSSLTSTAPARVWTWADASTGRQYTSAVATLDGLTPGAAFYYRVGSADGWSAVTRSAATRAPAGFSEAAPLRIGWLGDLGVVNDQALPYLLNETGLDLFIHVGDCKPHMRAARAAHSPIRVAYSPCSSPPLPLSNPRRRVRFARRQRRRGRRVRGDD